MANRFGLVFFLCREDRILKWPLQKWTGCEGPAPAMMVQLWSGWTSRLDGTILCCNTWRVLDGRRWGSVRSRECYTSDAERASGTERVPSSARKGPRRHQVRVLFWCVVENKMNRVGMNKLGWMTVFWTQSEWTEARKKERGRKQEQRLNVKNLFMY